MMSEEPDEFIDDLKKARTILSDLDLHMHVDESICAACGSRHWHDLNLWKASQKIKSALNSTIRAIAFLQDENLGEVNDE